MTDPYSQHLTQFNLYILFIFQDLTTVGNIFGPNHKFPITILNFKLQVYLECLNSHCRINKLIINPLLTFQRQVKFIFEVLQCLFLRKGI